MKRARSRRRSKENFERMRERRLCFKSHADTFLRICATTRSVVVAYFQRKYAGVFVLRTSKERKAFFRQRHTALISFAGVAELADAQDLGSCVNSCRFKSCHPHQKHKDGFCRPYVFRMSLLTLSLSNSQELNRFAQRIT